MADHGIYEVELNNGVRLRVGHEFLFRDNYSECVVVGIDRDGIEIECGLTLARFEASDLWPGSKIVEA